MTIEEQIALAKKHNLGTTPRDEYKSKIINSIESKFELGSYDYSSEEGKKRKNEMLNEWAKQEYEANIHNGMDKDEAKKAAVHFACEMFKQMQSVLSRVYPLMIWTIADNNIQQLVSECTAKIELDYKCELKTCFFDAKVGSDQEFSQIIRKANAGDIDIVVVLNFTYAQDGLWNLLFAYLKDNMKDDFLMIASSPLEPEDGVKTNWDKGLAGTVLQSVLLSE